MRDLLTTGKKALKTATAAYATYETAKKSARTAADKLCHTWLIDEDYTVSLHEAATELIERHGVKQLGQREHREARYNNRAGAATKTDWAWMPVPGVSRFLQVKILGDTITFRAPLRADLDRLLVVLEKIELELAENQPEIAYRPEQSFRPSVGAWDNKSGEWNFRRARTGRSFDSVILPAELQAEIENDLGRFTESRSRLQRLEVPWRRGYLFEGPPGTGKTSVSLAIAAALQFNIASLSLTDIESDGMLRKAVSALPQMTVLVIEDIDAYSISHDRDHNAVTDGALSLSGLLNSLDGFETPDGLVTICTTNHVDKLDEALVRAGRLDRTFHLGFMGARELERLFAWFYEEAPAAAAPAVTADARLSPAYVAELFKQHLDSPEAGWASVLAEISARTGHSVVAAVQLPKLEAVAA